MSTQQTDPNKKIKK